MFQPMGDESSKITKIPLTTNKELDQRHPGGDAMAGCVGQRIDRAGVGNEMILVRIQASCPPPA